MRIHTLENDRVAKHCLKSGKETLLEQLEVPSHLKVVTRRAWLNNTWSRISFGIKVDLLSFKEGANPRITWRNAPELEALQRTLINAPLAPVVQGGVILSGDNGGRTQDKKQALA
jgi:hypothetical protein